MTTIQEILKQYTSTNPNSFRRLIEQTRLDRLLHKQLKKRTKIDAAAYYLLTLIDDVLQERFSVELLASILNEYSITTLEDYLRWGENLEKSKIRKILNDIIPQPLILDKDKLHKEITGHELIEIVKELVPDEIKGNKFDIIPVDRKYSIPTKIAVHKIIEHSKINKLKYIRERRDCDDFALMFKAYLSQFGYGNLTIGIVIIDLYDTDNKLYGAHALNLCLYYDPESQANKLVFIEPQTDQIKQLSERIIGENHYKIRRVRF